ncbi:hypothetical protein ACFWJY_24240 [Streptomyces anulatus]|uniref:hypothetical protein n=1 Tax=Streptomyces anulatus TaxID=1892 RepID=UPI003652D714
MDLSIYDAVNSIRTIGKPYLVKDPTAAGAYGALDSAIDHAAYSALRGAFPNYPVAAPPRTWRPTPPVTGRPPPASRSAHPTGARSSPSR